MHIFAIPKRELLAWKVLIWCVMATLYSYEPRIFFFARNEVPKKFFFTKTGRVTLQNLGLIVLSLFYLLLLSPKREKVGGRKFGVWIPAVQISSLGPRSHISRLGKFLKFCSRAESGSRSKPRKLKTASKMDPRTLSKYLPLENSLEMGHNLIF